MIAKKIDLENSSVCNNCFEIYLEYLFTYYNFEQNTVINPWFGEDSFDHGKYGKGVRR